MNGTLEPGRVVVIHLASPREQVFGVVRWLHGSGVLVRGINMSSVDDWLRQFGGDDDHPLGLALTFYPMHRVEKIAMDESDHGVPSIQERFLERTGMTVTNHVESAHPTD